MPRVTQEMTQKQSEISESEISVSKKTRRVTQPLQQFAYSVWPRDCGLVIYVKPRHILRRQLGVVPEYSAVPLRNSFASHPLANQ